MKKNKTLHLNDYFNDCAVTVLTSHAKLIKFLSAAELGSDIDNDPHWQNEAFLDNDESLTGIYINSRSTKDKLRDEELFFLLDESPEAIEEGRRVKEAISVKYNRDNSFARWETVHSNGDITINNDYLIDNTTVRFFCNEDGSKEFVHVTSDRNYDDKSSVRLERELHYLRIGDNLKEAAKSVLGFCIGGIFGLKENASEMLGFEKRTKGECAAARIRRLSQRYTPID
jgi:hypothetical protein